MNETYYNDTFHADRNIRVGPWGPCPVFAVALFCARELLGENRCTVTPWPFHREPDPITLAKYGTSPSPVMRLITLWMLTGSASLPEQLRPVVRQIDYGEALRTDRFGQIGAFEFLSAFHLPSF